MSDESIPDRPGPRSRAAGVFGWTEPLRALRQRQRRLANACLRAALLFAASLAWLLIAPSQKLLGSARWPTCALLLVGLMVFAWLARRAASQVGRLEREEAQLEAQAVAALDKDPPPANRPGSR